MHRVLFEIPGTPLRLHSFGLMLCLAFFAAIALADWRARRSKLNPDWVYDLAFWILFGALIGARGLYVWQYWGTHVHRWTEIFAIWEGGIVLYGGVFGGLVAGLYRARRLRVPVRAFCDAVAPSIALGLAIGRVGCFLNGCCYGDPTNLPWAVTFPAESSPWYQHVRQGALVYPSPQAKPPWGPYLEVLDPDGKVERVVRDTSGGAAPRPPTLEQRVFEDRAGKKQEVLRVRVVTASLRSLPVHPTQLYSSLDGLILLALLSAYYPLRKTDGEVAALLLIAYPITRFLIEQLRGDEGAFVAGLTISQAVSVAMLVSGMAFWSYLQARPRVRYADHAGSETAAGASETTVRAQARG